MSKMLFDASPEEVEQAGKKKARKRRVVASDETPARVAVRAELRQEDAKYIASIEGHVTCDECGIGVVDLVCERLVNGQKKWLVQCGWSCLTCWLIDPIPGILDQEDRRQASQKKEFVVRDGRFAGMTFSQMERGHVQALAAKGRTYVAAAAKEWLASN